MPQTAAIISKNSSYYSTLLEISQEILFFPIFRQPCRYRPARLGIQFQQGGGRVWVVSTGSPDNIRNVMRHTGIGGPDDPAEACPEGRLDGILTGADVTRSKPDPECFLEAMRREGCRPEETLIFEDSDIGMEAARRSGAGYIRVKL